MIDREGVSMKRFIALFFATVMIFTLAACGGNTSDAETGNTSAKDITLADLDGEWIREDNGWPVTISSGHFKVMENKSGGSTFVANRYISSVENGIASLSWEKGEDDYTVVVENGKATRLEGKYTYIRLERPVVNMGESFKDNGIAEVTINEISGYPRFLNANSYTPADSSGIDAGDGMLFMEIRYTVKNMYKTALNVPYRGVQITVKYGDGYQFGTEDGGSCYYRKADNSQIYTRAGSTGRGDSITLAPLTESEFFVYIPVAEVLATDTETPMAIDITLESDDSFAYGSVKIR